MKNSKNKKVISTILALVLVLLSSGGVSEATSNKTYNLNIEKIVALDISRLDTLPKEETYSIDEVIQIMENSGYTSNSIESFRMSLTPEIENYNRNNIYFQIFSMDRFSFESGGYRYNITPRVWVGLEYLPGQSTPTRIVALRDAHVDTSVGYGNSRCEFRGQVSYNLTSGRSFQTVTYGDAYGYGVMNVTGSVQIGIGGFAIATINLGNPSNFLRTISFPSNYYSAALDG